MIDFKEYGYTPNNFQTLVDSTNLNNTQFMKLFSINKASFYFYKNGSQTMQHKDWINLVKEVEKYLKK